MGGNTDYCGYLANGGQRCLPWCNTYTCASHPIDCGTCAGENGAPNCVNPSTHCESWCSQWTTNSQYCVPGATVLGQRPSQEALSTHSHWPGSDEPAHGLERSGAPSTGYQGFGVWKIW